MARAEYVGAVLLLAIEIGGIAKTFAAEPAKPKAQEQLSDSGALPVLLKEGALSLAAVYNPAAIDLVVIDSAGRVSCAPKRSARAPQSACRDPRIVWSWDGRGGVSRYYQDGVHLFSGAIDGTSRVALKVRDVLAKVWSLEVSKVPRGCGHEGFVRQQKTLTVDLTCAGDVAVVRWVIWKSFLTRECDRTQRSTRAIGPDLRCRIRTDDAHAEVLDSGVELIDLRTGGDKPIQLEP